MKLDQKSPSSSNFGSLKKVLLFVEFFIFRTTDYSSESCSNRKRMRSLNTLGDDNVDDDFKKSI